MCNGKMEWSIYLAAWAEVLALGIDTLVVVDVVLPAVLGPTKLTMSDLGLRHQVGRVTYWFCWGKRAS